jgi:hypothetical protein
MMDIDMTQYIKAKSDQLNADDLMGGPITVQIIGVKETGSKEQPILVEISGGHQPWKPCKTERRILVALWEGRTSAYVSRSVKLFRDPTAVFQGKQVGGVRIEALSDIEGDAKIMVTESRGKKKERLIKRLVIESTTEKKQTEPPKPLNESEFAEKLKQVEAAILAGKISAEASITRLSKTVLLTEAQKQAIRDIEKPAGKTGAQADPEDGMFD